MTNDTAIAQLRHLYANLTNGAVRDTASAKRIATGLLGPVIESIEAASQGAEPAKCTHRIADATNQAIVSGYVCIDCGALFAAAPKLASPEPSDERSERLTAACAKVFGWPASDTAAGAAELIEKTVGNFREYDHDDMLKAVTAALAATPPAATQVPSGWTERQTYAALTAGECFGAVAMTREHGPYAIDRPTYKCDRFVEAIVAARDAQWLALRTPAAPEAGTEPMRKHVEDFAAKAGWKREAGEGAFEFVQRISYRQGLDDAKDQAGSDSTDAAREDGSEPTEKQRRLYELADRIDHEQLWSWAGMDHHKLTPEQRDRMDAGVELRRYGAIWKADRWIVIPPTGPTRYSAVTLDGAVKMAKKDEARKASGSGKGQA